MAAPSTVDVGPDQPPRRWPRRSRSCAAPRRSIIAGGRPRPRPCTARSPSPVPRSAMARPDRVRLVVLFGGRSAEHEVSCITAAHVLRGGRPRPLRRRSRSASPGTAAGSQADDARPPWHAARPRCRPRPTASRPTGRRSSRCRPSRRPPTTAGRGAARCSTAPWARTAPSRACSSWPACPTSAPACWPRRCAWTRPWPRRSLAAHGLPQVPLASALRDAEIDGAADARWRRRARLARVREAGQPGVVGGRDQGRTTRPSSTRRSTLAAAYDEWVVVEEGVTGREIEVGRARQRRPAGVGAGRDRVRATSSTTTRTSTSTAPAELLVPAPLDDGGRRPRCGPLAVAAYRALRCDGMARVDFFYEEGRRGASSSTRSTPSPGSPRSRCTRSCGRRPGCRYPELIDELVRLAVERHDHRSRFSTKR